MRTMKRKGDSLMSYYLTFAKYVLLAVTGKQEVGEEELRLV